MNCHSQTKVRLDFYVNPKREQNDVINITKKREAIFSPNPVKKITPATGLDDATVRQHHKHLKTGYNPKNLQCIKNMLSLNPSDIYIQLCNTFTEKHIVQNMSFIGMIGGVALSRPYFEPPVGGVK